MADQGLISNQINLTPQVGLHVTPLDTYILLSQRTNTIDLQCFTSFLLQITRGDDRAAGSGELPSQSRRCPQCRCVPPLRGEQI